jgi:hypothetical protein
MDSGVFRIVVPEDSNRVRMESVTGVQGLVLGQQFVNSGRKRLGLPAAQPFDTRHHVTRETLQ